MLMLEDESEETSSICIQNLNGIFRDEILIFVAFSENSKLLMISIGHSAATVRDFDLIPCACGS